MKIEINNNQIKHSTPKAFLVTIPRSNLKFWIPTSLVFNKGYYSICYLPEDMTFYCEEKNGKKITISADSLAKLFSNSKINKEQIKIIHHVPKQIKATKVEIDDDLKR
ncbi:hypothetical protein [Lactobacillus jensenii]|jgi:hypothetical protein|uniref:hypothetical protein n=1 Tax=Lactobacillus jensenii TaxID=109790 RepID=UPI001F0991CD|nr:hypothetical protein [Lactobacillus jensenii]DAU52723.1 MAG TPA: hypothetical protein [Caudoviricetes sp.]